MKKLIIILVLLLSPVFANAEFTVDHRSFYHLGVSAALSGTCNAMTIKAQNPTVRLASCFTAALSVGAFKEFVLDGHPSTGDMAFNALGSFLGVYITDKIFLSFGKDSVMVGGSF